MSEPNLPPNTLRRSEVAGFVLAEALYPSGLKQPKHSHDLATLTVVLNGSYTERLGRDLRTCDRSSIIFNPAGETHSVDYHHEGAHIFNLRLMPERLQYVREYSDLFGQPLHFKGGLMAWVARRIYHEFNSRDKASSLAIEGLTLEVFAEATRRGSDATERMPPPWLRRAVDLIHDQFSESLTLDQVANSVGVHASHLARAFRKRHSCTVGEYVRRLRIEFAARELSSSDTPLSNVALSAGFCDQSHFSRVFKLHMGLTPAEYRKVTRSR